jgi:hypothetical protein
MPLWRLKEYAKADIKATEALQRRVQVDYDESIETIRAERAAVKLKADLEDKRVKVTALEDRLRYTGDGTIIKFEKKFANSDKVYKYAALNTNGRWYTTGQTNAGGFLQEDFILWLASGEGVTIIEVFDEL